ncbi:MAG TPA: 6,7-dimethyl-8-ribityllumazine synthase [archaeon]|nr:6,7-dimethyl-8-ribityllumazine synthase [archaeon]
MPSIAILCGSFHAKEVEVMLKEAEKTADKHGLDVEKIQWVPGSMEKPLALKKLLQSKGIDGAVVLGIIEKGETKHGLVMAHAVIKSIIELELEFMKPVGVGILGPEIEPHQIESRLKLYAHNAVNAVAEMLEQV